MEILISFPNANRRGGVERIVCETANFLSGKGHEITVLAESVEPNCLDESVQHLAVGSASRWEVALGRFARESSRKLLEVKQSFDVHGAFCTASPPGGVLWVQAVHKEWIRIAQMHRSTIGRAKQWLNPFHRVALQLESHTIGNRLYKRLIALTPTIANELIHHYGVPTSDIDILPNGVNPAEFKLTNRNEKARIRKELRLPLEGTVVLFVANETERKGFVPLLRAIAGMSQPRPHLLAVGRLGGEKYWISLLRRLGIDKQVMFIGPTSNVATAYAASDVFVLPTIYEAWGLVIVEALASGLPVLTSRLAGASEAIVEGKNGLLLDNPAKVEEIASKLKILINGEHDTPTEIRNSIAKYHWQNILAQYENILNHCV